MNIRLLPVLIFALGAFLFSACGEIEDIITDPSDTNSISATINGEEFSLSGLLVTAEYTEQTEYIQSIAILGAKLPFDGIVNTLGLVIVSADSSGISEGEEYTSGNIQKTAAGEYSINGDSQDIQALSSNTSVATVTVTEIDFDTKLISGTFSFDAVDENDSTATVYEVRDGVFKDVSFE